jgi:Cdc6-like AAA superfamily ATPase
MPHPTRKPAYGRYGSLLIAQHGDIHCILPGLANRHGLITGATGTGKTVTLQKMAESFAQPACRCSWPTSRAT